jgi:hypothetical protein
MGFFQKSGQTYLRHEQRQMSLAFSVPCASRFHSCPAGGHRRGGGVEMANGRQRSGAAVSATETTNTSFVAFVKVVFAEALSSQLSKILRYMRLMLTLETT